MSIFDKVLQAGEAYLDTVIEKAKSDTKQNSPYDRKAMFDFDTGGDQQYGWKERRGLVGPDVLKNMSRKDSVISAIIQTRLTQVAAFAHPQKDRYSPGFAITPVEHADMSKDEKLQLSDPSLDDEARKQLAFKIEQDRIDRQQKQEDDIKKIQEFLAFCGEDPESTDADNKYDFPKFVKLIAKDRLVYNYSAIELIPNKEFSRISKFYPVASGTIKLVTRESAQAYRKLLLEELQRRTKQAAMYGKDIQFAVPNKDFKYVQVIRGKVVAAWTEDELVWEAANPSVDPEDNGYAPGELELLLTVITSHLYAEAHNRNFFTQGIGTKGLLHIKGDNISRAQLEAFKRQWFNQLASSRNAFRPPIIGMADEVKWIELAQSNRDMEFDNWMHYLIRIACAVFQIDPAEINFDISKVNTSTLNESSNEIRLKFSRDKGLKPLLDFIEDLVNNFVLARWNPELAKKYKFKFVGLEAETKIQEIDRLKKETEVWKTVNEARIEMGYSPIEDGDIILSAAFTQFRQARLTQENPPEESMDGQDQGMDEEEDSSEQGLGSELDDLSKELDSIAGDTVADVNAQQASEKEEQAASDKKKADAQKMKDKVKKSSVIEYYIPDDNE